MIIIFVLNQFYNFKLLYHRKLLCSSNEHWEIVQRRKSMLPKKDCTQCSLNPLILIHACHALISVGRGRKSEYYEKSSCIIVQLHRCTHYISSLFHLVLLLHRFHFYCFQLSPRIISCYLGSILLISFQECLLIL